MSKGKKAITIDGIPEIKRNLAKLEAKVTRKVVRAEMRKGLKPVAAAVNANAPVGETGKLKGSAKVRSGRSRGGRISMRIVIGADKFPKFYAAFVALGTKKMPPDRFMKQAFDTTKAEALASTTAGIIAGIEKAAKGS